MVNLQLNEKHEENGECPFTMISAPNACLFWDHTLFLWFHRHKWFQQCTVFVRRGQRNQIDRRWRERCVGFGKFYKCASDYFFCLSLTFFFFKSTYIYMTNCNFVFSSPEDKAAQSLLNKLIRSNLVQNTNQVEVLQKDPNSPLYSVKSFEELRL